MAESQSAWRGRLDLQFERRGSADSQRTIHQGQASSPLKLQRAQWQSSGHCELPILHTAGGLVGGDELQITAQLSAKSQALLTSVAAQKVYGSVGRSRQQPQGIWSRQALQFDLKGGSQLEWLPQELVLYANGLFEQTCRVELEPGASFLGAEIVRLGRTAAGEDLEQGCWRSALEIHRNGANGGRWELVDRLELKDAALTGEHGMAAQPVFGSLAWVAGEVLSPSALENLLQSCREQRAGLEGTMACGALEQGLVARYRGPSSQAARFWFCRIWALIRSFQGQAAPEPPRVWPFQESPLGTRA
ncbi:urease accessory protein UreD [Synechococcus sp. A10-1-5-1]|uniref:urease accessory protein UreD n=1 Tax=Synechococcus sp. A10-1-5-1 TaxID=2936507 RepID=UPI0020017178|nr:urease accessory protein UreD [Synechococcus sp. A10-1-5-1]UPM49469.1 urease accessory protein UreD [Synechococcus sp. A10-1-5-1]